MELVWTGASVELVWTGASSQLELVWTRELVWS